MSRKANGTEDLRAGCAVGRDQAVSPVMPRAAEPAVASIPPARVASSGHRFNTLCLCSLPAAAPTATRIASKRLDRGGNRAVEPGDVDVGVLRDGKPVGQHGRYHTGWQATTRPVEDRAQLVLP